MGRTSLPAVNRGVTKTSTAFTNERVNGVNNVVAESFDELSSAKDQHSTVLYASRRVIEIAEDRASSRQTNGLALSSIQMHESGNDSVEMKPFECVRSGENKSNQGCVENGSGINSEIDSVLFGSCLVAKTREQTTFVP